MPDQDIYRAYNFRLDIQGAVAGYFTEVSGFSVHVESIEYREGGAALPVRKLPGRVSVGDVTCRYGLTSTREMWDWLVTAVEGRVERKNISIILVNPNGVDEAARWNLTNTWVSDWRGAKLDAVGNQAAIETITLVAETLERAGNVAQSEASETA